MSRAARSLFIITDVFNLVVVVVEQSTKVQLVVILRLKFNCIVLLSSFLPED